MRLNKILIGILLLQMAFNVCCEKITKSSLTNIENINRPDFRVIGDTSNCTFNSIFESYEENELFDFDLDGVDDFQYLINSVYDEPDEITDPNCNPDSGCISDYWPTIYTEFIIKNIRKYQICIDENECPLSLQIGDTISNQNLWLDQEILLLYRDAISNSWPMGNWSVNKTGYLGLRYFLSYDTLYSWIKMQWNSEGLLLFESSEMK